MAPEKLLPQEGEVDNERTQYEGKPVIFDVTKAHSEGLLDYKSDGSLLVQPELTGESEPKLIPPIKQKPTTPVIMTDIQEPLSRALRSPHLEEDNSLRTAFERSIDGLRNKLGKGSADVPVSQSNTLNSFFEEEYLLYQTLLARDYADGKPETDYGNYLYDPETGFIFTIPPEHVYRLGLIISNSKVLTAPDDALTWVEIREIFDDVEIGIIGSGRAGSNVLEGIVRDISPKKIAIADPDYVSMSNFNGLNRATLFDLVDTRGDKNDPFNPYEISRPNKAARIARWMNLVNPYLEIEVWDRIDQVSLPNFIRGKSIIFEEVDDMQAKYDARVEAKKQRVMISMMSDFGVMAAAETADFSRFPDRSLALNVDDEELERAMENVRKGGKQAFWDFAQKLVGEHIFDGSHGRILRGESEQTTGGLPQLGATAMGAGRLASFIVSSKLLGYKVPARIYEDPENWRYIVEYDKNN